MRKTFETIGYTLTVLVAFDLLILFTSLAQIAVENRTGHWAPFWRVQAEFLIGLLQ